MKLQILTHLKPLDHPRSEMLFGATRRVQIMTRNSLREIWGASRGATYFDWCTYEEETSVSRVTK